MARKKNQSLSNAIREGGRFHFNSPSVDQLLAMVLTLSGELWAVRERLATLESAGARKGVMTVEELDRHIFTDAEELQLAELRKEFLATLFGILETSSSGERQARSAARSRPAVRRSAGKKPAKRTKKQLPGLPGGRND